MSNMTEERVEEKSGPGRKTGKKNATTGQIILIAKLLEKNLKKVTKGVVEYINGFSDEKIAETVGCSKFSVQKVRQENFGKLYHAPVNERRGALATRVEKLENFLKTLGYDPNA